MHESIEVIINANYVFRPFLSQALVATHFLYNVGRADFTQMGNLFYKKYRLRRYSLV